MKHKITIKFYRKRITYYESLVNFNHTFDIADGDSDEIHDLELLVRILALIDGADYTLFDSELFLEYDIYSLDNLELNDIHFKSPVMQVAKNNLIKDSAIFEVSIKSLIIKYLAQFAFSRIGLQVYSYMEDKLLNKSSKSDDYSLKINKDSFKVSLSHHFLNDISDSDFEEVKLSIIVV